MKNSQKIFYGAVLILILFMIWTIFFNKSKIDYATPTPTTYNEPDKAQKYIDMLTQKCYNGGEVEVPCKG